MEAAATLFREKGFDGTTMTEVAARSHTAFGSLYRFFSSKEVLADALLMRYARLAFDRLDEIRDKAICGTTADLADLLIDLMLSLEPERSFAITVANTHSEREQRLTRFRLGFEARIEALLRECMPGVPGLRLQVAATMTLHIMRGVALQDRDQPVSRDAFVQEVRLALRLFLSHLSQ